MAFSATQALISTDDFRTLVVHAALAADGGDPDAHALLEKLRRATVCAPDELPEDVVALNSRVLFRLGDDASVRGTLLVHPHNLVFPSAETSAMTPLGTALLGLRPGEGASFAPTGGAASEVTVEGVGWRLRSSPAMQGRRPGRLPPSLLN